VISNEVKPFTKVKCKDFSNVFFLKLGCALKPPGEFSKNINAEA
jgi:hypothetical protein